MKYTINKVLLFFLSVACSTLIWFSTSYADSIVVTWIGNTEPDLAGYYLYYGTAPGNYGPPLPLAAHVTAHEITGLNEGTRYYITLTAIDYSNNESEPSPEISGIAQPDTGTSSSSSSSTSTTTSVSYGGIELQNSNNYSGTVLPLEEEHFYIQVPPGQTLLEVELTGNPDADLYVRFNEPPTLALWDCRPYTDNNSNEFCAFTNPVPGTYYIMIRGYSGTVNYNLSVQYSTGSSTTSSMPTTTTTTVSTGSDTIPPTGVITINNGQTVTNLQTVILYLSAHDNAVPLSKNGWMSFSNDNQEWSDPEPFSEEKAWILTAGEGVKTVYVLFGDGAGNWMSLPAQDDILYQESQNTSCDQTVKLQASAISASSESLPFYAKENAIDGDLSTAWSTIFRIFQRDEYFTIDLGDAKNITSLSMYSSRLFGTDFFPSNFKIQVSNDNSTWVDMETVQGHSTPLDSSSPDSWQYSSLECRYLKVSITKSRAFLFFFRVAQIAEIEVYGCDRGEQLPLISEENRSINKKELPKIDAESQRTPLDQQVPGIPGKPVIKFVN